MEHKRCILYLQDCMCVYVQRETEKQKERDAQTHILLKGGGEREKVIYDSRKQKDSPRINST